MLKILLALVLVGLAWCPVNAGMPVLCGVGNHFVKIHDMPSDFMIREPGTETAYHADLGIEHKQFSVLGVPIFNYGEERYVYACEEAAGLTTKAYVRAEISRPELSRLINKYHLAQKPELPFWHAYGGKLLIGLLMGAYLLSGKKKKDAKNKGATKQTGQTTRGRDAGEDASRAPQDKEDEFLYYLFSMLSKMAKADGYIDADEIAVAQDVFDRFEFAANHREFCAKVFNHAKNESTPIYWYAERFAQISNNEICQYVYEVLWDVACADGWLHPMEKEILKSIAISLMIDERYYNINYRRHIGSFTEGDKHRAGERPGESGESTRRARKSERRSYVSGKSSILEAYEILECSSSATEMELKNAYHTLAKRYHPDLLRQNGVPEEMITEATILMSQINAAWRDIKASRGFK